MIHEIILIEEKLRGGISLLRHAVKEFIRDSCVPTKIDMCQCMGNSSKTWGQYSLGADLRGDRGPATPPSPPGGFCRCFTVFRCDGPSTFRDI